MILYHGSQRLIEHPVYGQGNAHNDYGLGFYCSESVELAKEWACTAETSGFANKYELDLDGLTVLDLLRGDYHILNWLSILLQNRTFRLSSDLAIQAKDYLTAEFLPEYKSQDVIRGYRADDSYFSFAASFINNAISLSQLEKAMYLGKLGEQIVLLSEKAFARLRFLTSIPAEGDVYYPRKLSRDTTARSDFRTEKNRQPAADAVYMIDILRGRWNNDDPRLRRVLLG